MLKNFRVKFNRKVNKGDIIANEYSPNDIIGIDEFTEISLISSGDYGSNELIKVIINDNELMYTFDTGAEGFDISPSMEKLAETPPIVGSVRMEM